MPAREHAPYLPSDNRQLGDPGRSGQGSKVCEGFINHIILDHIGLNVLFYVDTWCKDQGKFKNIRIFFLAKRKSQAGIKP